MHMVLAYSPVPREWYECVLLTPCLSLSIRGPLYTSVTVLCPQRKPRDGSSQSEDWALNMEI